MSLLMRMAYNRLQQTRVLKRSFSNILNSRLQVAISPSRLNSSASQMPRLGCRNSSDTKLVIPMGCQVQQKAVISYSTPNDLKRR